MRITFLDAGCTRAAVYRRRFWIVGALEVALVERRECVGVTVREYIEWRYASGDPVGGDPERRRVFDHHPDGMATTSRLVGGTGFAGVLERARDRELARRAVAERRAKNRSAREIEREAERVKPARNWSRLDQANAAVPHPRRFLPGARVVRG